MNRMKEHSATSNILGNQNLIAKMAGIVFAVIIVAVVFIPIVSDMTSETMNIQNTGAGWTRFAYYEDAEDYSVALSSDGTTLTMGTQSGTADDMIVWASDAAAVLYDGGSFRLLYLNGDSSAYSDLGSSATIASASGSLTIADSTSATAYTSDAIEWAYAPSSTGIFAFYDTGGSNILDYPVAAAGLFAGVNTYNDLSSAYGFTMNETVTEGTLEDATWEIGE